MGENACRVLVCSPEKSNLRRLPHSYSILGISTVIFNFHAKLDVPTSLPFYQQSSDTDVLNPF